MGLFSWLTADTKETVAHHHNPDGCRVVYLLQPNGQPPIIEPSYDGYGRFGDTTAYAWLAKANLPAGRLAGLSDDALYTVGLRLAYGEYFLDPFTGRKMSIFHEVPAVLDPDIHHYAIRYDDPVPGFDGRSANDLIEAGVLEKHNFQHLVRFPLKFSYDPNAMYEALPASEDCPDQGWLPDDEPDEGC